jgi:hypothetical protein
VAILSFGPWQQLFAGDPKSRLYLHVEWGKVEFDRPRKPFFRLGGRLLRAALLLSR